jgi:acyl-CoA thioester hydrolase
MKPPALSLSDILALEPACLRTTVPESWFDSNGHMNMRWYVAVFDDAGDDLHDRVGLTAEFHRRNTTGTVDLEHHTNFLSEVMKGDDLTVYARLVKRSAKRVHYMMFLVNETRGAVAATFECMNAFLDKKIRRTAPFPSEIAALIDERVARDSTLSWPAPLSGSMQV